MTREISEDEFYERFRPIENDGNGNILFETYGDEYNFVVSQDPRCIWTLLDGDSGDEWIVSGWHFVNRQNYIITEVPVPEDEAYEVLWWSDNDRDDCLECGQMFVDIESDNVEGFCMPCRVEMGMDDDPNS